MRILYGVVGEGMGHATRSRVVLEHLLAQGHQVQIMASGRAKDFLAKKFDLSGKNAASGVNAIHGFHMITEENRVRLGKTVWSNVLAGTTGVPQNIAAYFDLIKEFEPEAVISDFESWTYLFAKSQRLPVLSIDNMQIINRCVHDAAIIRGHEPSFQIAKAFVKSKLPFCSEYFITTFFRPEIRKPSTQLFPPILRPEILSAKRTKGDHLLVYQTAEGNNALAETLAKSGFPSRIYGMRRSLTEDAVEGNLTYRPFSETQFIEDLRTSRAVIAAGGFTLMGEAVYLHKPMLSVPLAKQFEQVMNGRYLEKLGYGKMAESLDDPGHVTRFLDALPSFEAKLAEYTQDGNNLLFGAVDGWLDKAEAGVA